MARILLAVTGSVAAIRTDALVSALRAESHDVRVMFTKAAEFFVPHWANFGPDSEVPVYRDHDEWPAGGWEPGDDVLHIELGKWADILLIAPLDANTLAKWAQGMADNLVTSVIRAWDLRKTMLVAPAMNTRMWEHPVTRRHLAQILNDRAGVWPAGGQIPSMEDILERFGDWTDPIRIVPPIEKRLACGDVGVGAMAEVGEIVWNVFYCRKIFGLF